MMSHDKFYQSRPTDEAERVAMVNFHKLEQELDAHNCVQALAIRDSDELKKGQVVRINAAMKRWYKETSASLKKLDIDSKKFAGFYMHKNSRTWLTS